MKIFKVFSAGFMHETHSFSPVNASLDNFKETSYYLGHTIDTKFRGTGTEMGAVLDLAEELNWELIHSIFASTTPSGLVTEDAYEHVVGKIVEGLRDAGPVDGIILVLHGAMVTEHVADAEAELLRRVREVVGLEVPIAVTFDIHANVGPDLAKHANIVSTFRTTPHVDMYQTAERAGRILQLSMLKECEPQLVYAQGDMFYSLDMGRTISGVGPMVDALRMADAAMKQHPEILDISINAGFDWSDKANVGSSVLVTHHHAPGIAKAIADELIAFAWKTRAEKTMQLLPVDEVIRIAGEPRTAEGPLLIGDFTDCPGGGAAGDGTILLKALLDADLDDVAYGSIADAAAANKGIEAGIGGEITVSLGGKIDPRFGGTPVTVTGIVVAISDGVAIRRGAYARGKATSFGPSCVLKVGRMKIIIASKRVQIDDREQFRIFGIQPETTNILACKAANHFRADYEKMSRRLIYVETGGIMSLNFEQFPFKNVRRPVWPLDPLN